MIGLDIIPLIKTFGYLGIFGAILLENSIPLLFFVPGDTLLLTAGLIASQGYLEIDVLVAGGVMAAIFGYMFGYFLGQRVGRHVFDKGESRYIKMEHLEKTKEFYNKYGSLSLLIARFLPLRACVVFIAGAVSMPYRTFMIFNVIGAVAWGAILPLLGYFLGQVIPIHNLVKLTVIPVLGIMFMVILVPVTLHLLRERSKRLKEKAETESEKK